MHCGHITDSSPLLKHKQGNIFNLIRTQAGSFLFISFLFKLVPMNNAYNGIIVDDLDQSISLNMYNHINITNKILIHNNVFITHQVIFLNSLSPELATIYRVSAAPTTE